jgi:hypothetical protein
MNMSGSYILDTNRYLIGEKNLKLMLRKLVKHVRLIPIKSGSKPDLRHQIDFDLDLIEISLTFVL